MELNINQLVNFAYKYNVSCINRIAIDIMSPVRRVSFRAPSHPSTSGPECYLPDVGG